MTLRRVASVSLAFFGVRRSSEVAGFRVADASIGQGRGVVEVRARCQKNDQFGAGQIARVVALPAWGGACPVCRISEWLRIRARLVRNRDCSTRMATFSEDSPLFVGLARARFGFGLASPGVSA